MNEFQLCSDGDISSTVLYFNGEEVYAEGLLLHIAAVEASKSTRFMIQDTLWGGNFGHDFQMLPGRICIAAPQEETSIEIECRSKPGSYLRLEDFYVNIEGEFITHRLYELLISVDATRQILECQYSLTDSTSLLTKVETIKVF